MTEKRSRKNALSVLYINEIEIGPGYILKINSDFEKQVIFLMTPIEEKESWHRKVRDHCSFTGKCRGPEHSICNLRFNVPNEIPAVFHSGLNYYYHFIIKELPNEFEGQFERFGENTEKYKISSVSIEKEGKKVDKDGNEDIITAFYRINVIDNIRFMASSLSNLVDNLAEGIQKI